MAKNKKDKQSWYKQITRIDQQNSFDYKYTKYKLYITEL